MIHSTNARFMLLGFLSLLTLSCNEIIEEVRQRQIETITYSDYTYDIDSKNRKGFLDKENKPMTGHFIVVHDSIKAEEFQLKDGFLNGLHRFYNREGALVWERHFSNNIRDGVQKSFYPTGELKSEVTYIEGRRESDKLGYAEDGTIIYRLTREGHREYEHFYINGDRRGSRFSKVIDGSYYDIIILYTAFGSVDAIFGKKKNSDEQQIFYFDEEYNKLEPIILLQAKVKAAYAFDVMRFSD